MTELQARVVVLVAQHGGLRPAARVLDIDPAYLTRLRHGQKVNPSAFILRRLGLVRVVGYEAQAWPDDDARAEMKAMARKAAKGR